MTKIEWVKSADGSQGKTWNPLAGCAIVSPGCTNCYAMKMAARLDAMGQAVYKGLTKPSKAGPVWRGTVRANPDALLAPLKRKKPTTYFVNSMSDLFYENFSDELIDQVFAVMALSPQHTFQVLTKRAERMRAYMTTPHRKRTIAESVLEISDLMARAAGTHKARPTLDHFSACFAGNGPFPNVWLGVSAERQQEANERIPLLLQTPAAVRFVSAEPLLAAIDLRRIRPKPFPIDALTGAWAVPSNGDAHYRQEDRLHWVIVGGESGPRSRPFDIAWARDIVGQCEAAKVACFVKQLGSNPLYRTIKLVPKDRKGGDWSEWPDDLRVREFPIRARSAGSLPLTIAGNEPGGRAGAVSS